jgi:hypothetical protein
MRKGRLLLGHLKRHGLLLEKAKIRREVVYI